MKNSAANKLKQVPVGYLVIGIDVNTDLPPVIVPLFKLELTKHRLCGCQVALFVIKFN